MGKNGKWSLLPRMTWFTVSTRQFWMCRRDIGKKFILHSGHSKLLVQNGQTEVVINGLWEGTIVFMELGTAKEIDSENVVEHRTKASDEYNEMFIDCDELTELW